MQTIDIGNGLTLQLNWDIIFESMRIDLVEELVRRAPKHDSGLRQSITIPNSKIIDDSLLMSMIDYALYVEYGTMPHWTSVKNLKKWALDKLGDEKLAYALQKHIAMFGTKPHPFIRETLKQESAKILAEALHTDGAVEVFQN